MKPTKRDGGVGQRQRRVKDKAKVSSKVMVSVRLDHDVIEWWRSTGPGYQTRMNAALRKFMEANK